MLTGELRNQVDQIWNAFWTGGISNPLEVIEQITYLVFLRRLDDLQPLQELKAQRLKKSIEHRIFPAGKDSKKLPYEQMRWSKFKNLEPRQMYTIVSEHVFPFLRTLGGDESTYAHHMKDARFTIPTPALLATGRQQALDILKDNFSKGQLSGGIGIMRQDIAARRKGIIRDNPALKAMYPETAQPTPTTPSQQVKPVLKPQAVSGIPHPVVVGGKIVGYTSDGGKTMTTTAPAGSPAVGTQVQ